MAVQTAEAEHLQRDAPVAPAGVDQQLLSVDGAFVPLVDGSWVEVKTLTLGEIQAAPVAVQGGAAAPADPASSVHTTHLSYFSRLSEAAEFTRLARVETHRRGVEHSALVCA
ncbi:MAG: hypothetical protein M1546_03785, partial [Chloroflexi bacterium]|nr:hypothetical protein [Chloroflexota bacterium]